MRPDGDGVWVAEREGGREGRAGKGREGSAGKEGWFATSLVWLKTIFSFTIFKGLFVLGVKDDNFTSYLFFIFPVFSFLTHTGVFLYPVSSSHT